MDSHWDWEVDLPVVGSDGGGMTAALVAKKLGTMSSFLNKQKFYIVDSFDHVGQIPVLFSLHIDKT